MNRTKENRNKSSMRGKVASGCALVILLSVFAVGQSQKPAREAQDVETGKPTYIGSDTCAGCHEDQANWLKGSIHDEETNKGVKGGCESCHGPGSVHAESPSKDNILTFTVEAASRRSDACLSCHGTRAGLSDFHRTKHRTNRVACDQCHGGNNSKAFHSMRTVQDPALGVGTRLCQSCHSEKRAEFSMPFRHRVNEGAVSCADCHIEHTGFMAGRRRGEKNNETCVRCHTEIQGPFVFQHMPTRVGSCTTCHSPHGSTNPRLLVRADMRSLCLECHTETPRTHDLSKPRYQNCTVCHTAVHGSNHNALLFQ